MPTEAVSRGAMPFMADYTKSGGISTAKARRKDSAVRNKTYGLDTKAHTKRNKDEKVDLAALVPEARQARPRTYIMVEHRRRDTAAVVRALDLTAPDAPARQILPAADDDGEPLEYAVVCVTHRSPPVHAGTASQARREAKASHKWCEGCQGDQASTPAARSKAGSKAGARASSKAGTRASSKAGARASSKAGTRAGSKAGSRGSAGADGRGSGKRIKRP